MTKLREALPETLRTARLTLAPPRLTDLPELVPLADNENVTRWTTRMPYPYAHADGVDFVENIATGADQKPYALRNEDGAFIGVASLMFHAQLPEVGYWLGEPFWGRGYASEALGALVAAARATGLAPMLAAKALADNKASLRVLEKQGFQRVREVPDDSDRHKGKPTVHLELEFER
ncbi:GNAT family N-acetyltransferase [Devosia geojensis]|uniref:GNAT family N-acetyltransferase n=1 Tax=Devosia geojensis TaxID=443610 RepID=UPI000696D614|nr:GNAT family N-acetyltransferase [Devosia geojensis]